MGLLPNLFGNLGASLVVPRVLSDYILRIVHGAREIAEHIWLLTPQKAVVCRSAEQFLEVGRLITTYSSNNSRVSCHNEVISRCYCTSRGFVPPPRIDEYNGH